MEIPKADDLAEMVFSINSAEDFRQLAIGVFQFQYYNNPVYRQYCKLLKTGPESISRIEEIPFLPISCFKTHSVAATVYQPQIIFESSGTTGNESSRHLVKDLDIYHKSFTTAFEQFYGPAGRYCFLGLLPSYLERQHSSLVYMVQELMKRSSHPRNGFFLYDFEKLRDTLQLLEQQRQPVILVGVTYALLDFAAACFMPLQHTIIMETGGMKGRKKELLRQEVHAILQDAFSVKEIHSEYGMTELLSQAYAQKEGRFQAPPWMKVLVREEDDPFCYMPAGKTGALNVIDLANIYSCSFISTEDIGQVYEDGTFTVAGRIDTAALRGCSLLYI